jgi:proline dehydrogenase
MKPYQILTTAFLCTLVLALSLSNQAMAHCDSMDGPVVKDAQRALSDKNVEPVLKWVSKEDEEFIRKAFDMTLTVRDESAAAKILADRYFFETLIRIHRASEGETFTGLKPAGSVDPAIAAADRALAERQHRSSRRQVGNGGAGEDKRAFH